MTLEKGREHFWDFSLSIAITLGLGTMISINLYGSTVGPPGLDQIYRQLFRLQELRHGYSSAAVKSYWVQSERIHAEIIPLLEKHALRSGERFKSLCLLVVAYNQNGWNRLEQQSRSELIRMITASDQTSRFTQFRKANLLLSHFGLKEIELSDGKHPVSVNSAEILRGAEEFYKSGEYIRAAGEFVEYFRNLIFSDSMRGDALVDEMERVARMFADKGRPELSEAIFRKCGRWLPDHSPLKPRVLYETAVWRSNSGNRESSLDLLRRVIQRYPNTAWGGKAIVQFGRLSYEIATSLVVSDRVVDVQKARRLAMESGTVLGSYITNSKAANEMPELLLLLSRGARYILKDRQASDKYADLLLQGFPNSDEAKSVRVVEFDL